MGEPTPSRYPKKCDDCDKEFKENDLIYYCPKSNKWICPKCFYDKYEGHEKCLEYEIINGKPQKPLELHEIKQFEKII